MSCFGHSRPTLRCHTVLLSLYRYCDRTIQVETPWEWEMALFCSFSSFLWRFQRSWSFTLTEKAHHGFVFQHIQIKQLFLTFFLSPTPAPTIQPTYSHNHQDDLTHIFNWKNDHRVLVTDQQKHFCGQVMSSSLSFLLVHLYQLYIQHSIAAATPYH